MSEKMTIGKRWEALNRRVLIPPAPVSWSALEQVLYGNILGGGLTGLISMGGVELIRNSHDTFGGIVVAAVGTAVVTLFEVEGAISARRSYIKAKRELGFL